jgi:hypothetical protein
VLVASHIFIDFTSKNSMTDTASSSGKAKHNNTLMLAKDFSSDDDDDDDERMEDASMNDVDDNGSGTINETDSRSSTVRELRDLRIQLEQSQLLVADLQEQVKEQANKIRAGIPIGRNKHWTKNIANWVKSDLFPKIKFITDDIVLDERGDDSVASTLREFFTPLKVFSDAEFESFWLTYKDDINKAMSNHRNTVATSIRIGFQSK